MFQIERIASGLSNSRSKWISEYCFKSNRLVDVADEHELAERRDDQRQRRQHHDDEQIDDGEAEREIAPGAEIEHAGRNALPATVV